ncbi:hypothetical protein KKG44_01855 [Patescibacteria group bacterium]|nr:hypothetical protein [Patescibacteria group bacterium]MBU2459842.1 hypothetical protein [Patescibacteria group bacterium]MBU2544097.1 hypothetical protein [Patescibacteria group bacterium]
MKPPEIKRDYSDNEARFKASVSITWGPDIILDLTNRSSPNAQRLARLRDERLNGDRLYTLRKQRLVV